MLCCARSSRSGLSWQLQIRIRIPRTASRGRLMNICRRNCQDAQSTDQWYRVLKTMLRLCTECSGHMVGFNGIAGNSLDHLHLVSHRPPDGHGLYAVQQVVERLGVRSGSVHIGPENGYPINVWRLSFPDCELLVRTATGLISEWQKVGGLSPTVNCAAALEHDQPTLYIFPRSALLVPWGWPGMPAILEMLGVFVASTSETVENVRSGAWGQHHFSQVLSSLRPRTSAKLDSFLEGAAGHCGH